MSQVCRQCAQEKPLAEFYVKDIRKSIVRYDTQCKDCTRAIRKHDRQHNGEHINACRRANYAANPEPHRTQERNRRLKSLETIRTRDRELYRLNKAREAAQRKQRRLRNLAKILQQEKLRRQRQRLRNPEKFLANLQAAQLRRRGRIAQAAMNNLTREQAQMLIETKNGVCDYCPYYNPGCHVCKKGAHKLTIDHITALSKQGDNTLWNVTACCHSCNSRKHTSEPPGPVQPFLLAPTRKKRTD